MLTEQCKKDFEKWLWNQKEVPMEEDLYGLPFSMQYGVLVDFFDTAKMQIYIKPIPTGNADTLGEWSIYIDNFGHHILNEYLYSKTRPEARIKAIERANEIYNNTLEQ